MLGLKEKMVWVWKVYPGAGEVLFRLKEIDPGEKEVLFRPKGIDPGRREITFRLLKMTFRRKSCYPPAIENCIWRRRTKQMAPGSLCSG